MATSFALSNIKLSREWSEEGRQGDPGSEI